MSYLYNPSSYANTFYGSPFARRSPSPATYCPRNAAYDSYPYIQALAEEQAARSALREAMQREQEARRRRAQEEAYARALAQEARARAMRQRPRSFYALQTGYPEYGYGYEDRQDEDVCSPFEQLFSTPRRSPEYGLRFGPASGAARSRACQHPQSVHEERQQQNAQESGPSSFYIPISTPTPATAASSSAPPSAPQLSEEVRNEAALKIQAAYRAHASRISALSEIKSISQRFETLRDAFFFPSELDFQDNHKDAALTSEKRPRLAYTARSTPIHAHEDALLKLLQALDAVESHGDAAVRDARRALVQAVEEELGRVDAGVRRAWEERASRTEEAAASEPTVAETEESTMETEPVTTSTIDAADGQSEPKAESASSSLAETTIITPIPITEVTASENLPAMEPETASPLPTEVTAAETTIEEAPTLPVEENDVDFEQATLPGLPSEPNPSCDVAKASPIAAIKPELVSVCEPIVEEEEPVSDVESELSALSSPLDVADFTAPEEEEVDDDAEMVAAEETLGAPASNNNSEVEFVLV
ncbi:hypothetical protein M0805_005626 [Coniferiporia weirii]|nr:hypothetical protein M0805_005626 [Coniferiporia weirii]